MTSRKQSTITPGFTRDDRSTFKYWFAHWAGFQVTALNLGIWKPKYLFHKHLTPQIMMH